MSGFEILIVQVLFTEKAITWSEVNEAIAEHTLFGIPVPGDIQEAFNLLGEDLDQMVATAPPEVVALA